MKLFVYGTLKKNRGNDWLLRKAKLLDDRLILYGFEMRSYGGFPVITPVDRDVQVIGELYEVNEEQLDSCDRLEGHPRFYQRIELVNEKYGEFYTYIQSNSKVNNLPLIVEGEW